MTELDKNSLVIFFTNKLAPSLFLFNLLFIAYLAALLSSDPKSSLDLFKEVRNLSYFVYIGLFIVSGFLIILTKVTKLILPYIVVNLVITTYAYYLASLLSEKL